MTNEEILKAAQSSKEDIGEYEKTVVRKSLAYGSAVGVGLCMLISVIDKKILKWFIEKEKFYVKKNNKFIVCLLVCLFMESKNRSN